MASSRKFRGVLLCEDKEHERFFRALFQRKWFERGKLRVERISNQEGAGDAFVLARFAAEAQLARSKRSENYALIVAIDGDHDQLRERLRQLDQRLERAGLDRRGENEKIVICVPTRNVETWELWLCGDRDLDETQNYKTRFHEAARRGEASAKKAVEAWFRSLSEEEERTEEKTLPSLAAGRREIRRLEG